METEQILDEGILLSFDEIKVLLYACGYRKVEGILLPEKKYGRDEIVQTLQRLTQRQIIEVREEHFQILSPCCEMCHIMGAPSCSAVWSPEVEPDRIDETPEFFCYFSDNRVVVSERYWRRKETVKLRLFSLEDFENWKESVQNDYNGC